MKKSADRKEMKLSDHFRESKKFFVYALVAAIVGVLLTFFVGCGKKAEEPKGEVLASKRIKIEPESPPPRTPQVRAPEKAASSLEAAQKGPAPQVQERKAERPPARAAEKKVKSAKAALKPWVINVASLLRKSDAAKLRERLAGAGYRAYITVFKKDGRTYYRVRVGFFSSRAEASKTGKAITARFRDVGKPWVVKPDSAEIRKFSS